MTDAERLAATCELYARQIVAGDRLGTRRDVGRLEIAALKIRGAAKKLAAESDAARDLLSGL